MHSTNQLVDNIKHAAVDFCTEHQLPPALLPKITEAMQLGALHTMQWQNERATADAVIVNEAAEQTAWSPVDDFLGMAKQEARS